MKLILIVFHCTSADLNCVVLFLGFVDFNICSNLHCYSYLCLFVDIGCSLCLSLVKEYYF